MLTGDPAGGRQSPSGSGPDLEPPAGRRFRWEDLDDGGLHRLRRGVDYTGSIKALAQDAQDTALLFGKVAAIYKEELGRHESLWVQFLEGRLQPGDACPACDGRALLREQHFFLRCRTCGALYRLVIPDPDRGLARAQAARLKAIVRGKFRMPDDERFPLSAYSDIQFHTMVRRQRRDYFFGRAVDPDGATVLLWASHPIPATSGPAGREEGESASSGPEWRIGRLPVAPYDLAIRLDRAPRPGAPLAPPEEGHASTVKRRARRLHDLDHVSLLHEEQLPGRDRLFGHATDPRGGPTLIYVDYPLVNGARVEDPELPGAETHTVYHWPTPAFGPVIDLDALPRP